MIRPLVRIIKGIYMMVMFALFEAGMLIVFLLVVPALGMYGAMTHPDPGRMQRVIRFLFGIWLDLLDAGGLMKAHRIKDAPVSGPCVVVANHPGLFDVLVMIRDIPQLSVLAKRSLRNLPGLDLIFRQAGFVFYPSEDDLSAAINLTNQAIGLLRQGRKFMLFPEGTRSPKGDMLPFKAGAFKIARAAGVPVQPVLIRNNPPFMPKEDNWYYPQFEKSVLEAEFLEPVLPPKAGQETVAAQQLEELFRCALGLPVPGKSPSAHPRRNKCPA